MAKCNQLTSLPCKGLIRDPKYLYTMIDRSVSIGFVKYQE